MSTQANAIVASLRDQLLDVRLGIITEDEWRRRVEGAVARGVEVPGEWKRS